MFWSSKKVGHNLKNSAIEKRKKSTKSLKVLRVTGSYIKAVEMKTENWTVQQFDAIELMDSFYL